MLATDNLRPCSDESLLKGLKPLVIREELAIETGLIALGACISIGDAITVLRLVDLANESALGLVGAKPSIISSAFALLELKTPAYAISATLSFAFKGLTMW